MSIFKSRSQRKSDQSVVASSGKIQKSQPKSIEQLEAEILRLKATGDYSPKRPKNNFFSQLKTLVLLIGTPAVVVGIANIPVPEWRSQVRKTAPILLFPTYWSRDQNYKQVTSNLTQAEQLINNPTSPADLELGEHKLASAKKALESLPGWYSEDDGQSLGWYSWYYTRAKFDIDRTLLANLESKLFQEKNAQKQLKDSELAINRVKQQYQQSKTPSEKKVAADSWQTELNKIRQISPGTLAGKNVRLQLSQYERDYQATVGLLASSESTRTLVAAAQKFAWQAALQSQNPPHRAEKWQQVIFLWEKAIKQLSLVSITDDNIGYLEAQKLLAEYQTNKTQIEVRLAAEKQATDSFENAQDSISRLVSLSQGLDRNAKIARLQNIINQLERIQPGTTPYAEAQTLLNSARQKVRELTN